MSEERDTHTEEQPNKPRFLPPPRAPRRQMRWWVLWAVGILIALVALSLLVANLYPNIWEVLSRERVATLIGMVVALTVIIVLLALGGTSLGWTGFGERKLWDWLELLSALAIPVVLAIAGFWFTTQQEENQQALEDRRAKREARIEEQRADDAAMQAYFDQMSTLLIEKDLRASTEDNATEDSKEARTLARARTLTVLARLDPSRKSEVMRFLVEATLVNSVDPHLKTDPILRLEAANLSEAVLRGANLSGADLFEAVLGSAVLSGADLRGADLRDADLGGAYLDDANLSGADLGGAYLGGADLSIADLSGADLRFAILSEAVLSEAVLFSADLFEANLSEAVLFSADLSGADLSGANLSGADLSKADLFEADLSEADLSEAEGVTVEQLAEAKSLEGATMPDGQVLKSGDNPNGPTFEDWVKSKGHGDGGENSGPSSSKSMLERILEETS
jgi:uncharacterized protein YjbI with pentapeptide repeats